MVTTRSERSGDSRAGSEDTERSSSSATSSMRLRSRSRKTDGETDAVVDKKSVIGGRQHLQRSAKDKVYAETLLASQSSRRALVSQRTSSKKRFDPALKFNTTNSFQHCYLPLTSLQGDVAHREGNKGNKEHAGPESTKDFIKRKWQDLGETTLQKPSRRAKINNGSTASDDNATNDSLKGKTFAPVTQSPPGKGYDDVGKEDDVMEINDASHQPPVGDTPTDIDEFDLNDPLCASTLVQEMYEVYRTKEMTMTQPAGYMDGQKFINERMRAILIDWLIDVHLKFKLVPETLHLTVNIIDRFLALAKVTRQRLQLLGVTAFLIATKYEEVYPPEIPDLVYICAGSYTKAEILEMEETILKTLNYQVTIPSAHAFLVRYLKAAKADVKIVRLSCFILDGTLLSYDLLQYRPSQLAAAAVLIARRTVGRRNWSPTLDKYAQYREDDILPIVRAVLSEKTLIPAELRAVRNKYKTARYGAVANIELPSDF